jgi:hypothetical protein
MLHNLLTVFSIIIRLVQIVYLFFIVSLVPNVCYLDASLPVDLKHMRGPLDWAMRCSIYIIFLT